MTLNIISRGPKVMSDMWCGKLTLSLKFKNQKSFSFLKKRKKSLNILGNFYHYFHSIIFFKDREIKAIFNLQILVECYLSSILDKPII